MKNIRTHSSHVTDDYSLPDHEKSLTEQCHAQALDIRTMMTQGFITTTATPMYGDFSELPTLDLLLNNRVRLQHYYNGLPTRAKRFYPTMDAFVHALLDGDEAELIDAGLIAAREELKEELNTLPNGNPKNKPAASDNDDSNDD